MVKKATENQSNMLPSLLKAISLIAGATLLANFVAAISISFLSPLLHSQADREVITSVEGYGTGPVVPLLSFLIPSILATLYIFPVYRICFTRKFSNSFDLAQRRLLSMPLVLSLIGLFGWLISIMGYFGLMRKQDPTVLIVIAGYARDSLLTGSLVFVISYYLLEFFSRKYFIPSFFPGAKLSECQGTLALSIQSRFYIFYFAVGIVPMLLMLNIIRTMDSEANAGGKLSDITILIGAVLLLGALLVYLISKSYQAPLVEMAHAAQRIQASDFEINIAVLSNDEVGNLGEALNEMAGELMEKEFIKDTFGKVVDPSVRDHLLSGHIDLGGELRKAAILFTDIRNFTSISAKMKPNQVVDWLNKYFDRMSQCIVEEGGIVNKYIGDAILAVFGVPIVLENHTVAAVRAAYNMKLAKDGLNRDLVREGFPPVHSGIGIHTGPVLAGNIGSSSRMEYTVIGDTVNVAARIEKLCKKFRAEIILSEYAVSQLGDTFQAQSLGPENIRGKEQPLRLFSIEI
jgi:adenylate cyclase